MHAHIANNADEPSHETVCKTAAEAVISFCVGERRPECRDSSWVDAEGRSFNWPFFSAFIEELDRLQNVEMVARQRDNCVRLAGPKTPSGLCKASPLQIVNQLVAQKRLVISSADGATSSVKKLQVSALMAHCSLLSDILCLVCRVSPCSYFFTETNLRLVRCHSCSCENLKVRMRPLRKTFMQL